MPFLHFYFNPLWPSYVTWQHNSGSTLPHVMACCLMAWSHYLNKCWLIISKVQWHSSENKLHKRIIKIRSKSKRVKSFQQTRHVTCSQQPTSTAILILLHPASSTLLCKPGFSWCLHTYCNKSRNSPSVIHLSYTCRSTESFKINMVSLSDMRN